MSTSKTKTINASEFKHKFDAGEVSAHLDVKSAKVHDPAREINLDSTKSSSEVIDTDNATY